MSVPSAHLGQFADLLTRIPPDTVTAVVRTPLGVIIQDPFSQEPSVIPDWIRGLIQVDVYMGPPRPDDLNSASLVENLKVAGMILGGLGVLWLTRSYWR